MRVRKYLLVTVAIALLVSSCSSSEDDEAVKTAVASACLLVTNAYETWGATGENPSTETGRIGRENLESSLDSAQNSLTGIISESELGEARDSSEEWTAENVTGARILLQIGNLQSFINDWESVSGYYNWIPGQMATIDGRVEGLKEDCEALKRMGK